LPAAGADPADQDRAFDRKCPDHCGRKGFLPLSRPGVGSAQDRRAEIFRMSIGVWQVVLILVIVLIIFGAGKLPKVMGDVAKGVKSFKEGLKDEDETKQIASEPSPTVNQSVKKDEPAKTP
jgi:sec-independent protein translocase protein TatA